MADYFEYTDRSERTLENLLIWWGTREPFEHADDCENPEQLHCCYGRSKDRHKGYALQGVTLARWPDNYTLYFVTPQGEKTVVEPGDRIYYLGDYVYEHVSKEAVDECH